MIHAGQWGLLLLSLAWTLWFVFAGFGNHQDPLYWLYKYQHMEGGWMASGTLLTGGAIVRLFGAQLLPLRLAGWLCVAVAIALPYLFMQNGEQRRANLHWLAVAYLLTGYGAFQEFSPGTLSVLLLSALWVTQSPVIAGLAVAVRFPNILVLPVMMVLWRRKSLWNVPIAALSAGAVYLLGYGLITPAAADAAMNSHALTSMINKLWQSGGMLAGYGLIAAGVLAGGRVTEKYKTATGIAVGAVLAYFIACGLRPLQWYNTDMTYLIAALCIGTALAARQRTLYSGIAIMAVATLGTDTGWLKLFPAVVCLLPLAATYHTEENKRYLWCAIAVMSIAVMSRMATNSIGQCRLSQADTTATIAPYTHLRIRGTEQERLAHYQADYDSLKAENHVLALGQEMHLMRAVTGCEAARYNEFWSNIYDSVYTAKYRRIIREERPIVFCSFSPQFKTKPQYKDRHSALEEMLREEGYGEIDRSRYKYMIYIPEP